MRCLQACANSPTLAFFSEHTRSQGPSFHRHCPASTVLCPCPTPTCAAARSSVEAATPAPDGSPPLPASPFRRAVPTTPADRDGCMCRLLPRSRGLPRFAGGSASAPLLSRPAQASLTLRPVGLLNRPEAAFVTRLRSGWLPTQTARQLPEQSTTLWVDPPSTGETRPRGALHKSRLSHTERCSL
jgi:hypothetical protein